MPASSCKTLSVPTPRNGPGTGTKDYPLLLAARVMRAFGFGFIAVLVSVYLSNGGRSAAEIGLLLGIALAASATVGLVFAAASRRIGRRSCLAIAGLLMAVSGLALAAGSNSWWPFLAAATGMMGASNIDAGPFAGVEQAVLAESVLPALRNMAFARYSLTGGVASAAGGLAAGLATTQPRIQLFLAIYAVTGLLTSLLAIALSADVESSRGGGATTRPTPHRRFVALTALLAVDSLGGGFVVPAVIALWLHVRFGLGAATLGPAFAAMSLVQATSSEVSGRLANRIGLIRTMVFTHLPSNVLLLLVPLAPNPGLAIVLLVARASLAQMDVPARQAYIVSVVAPTERAMAVATIGAARGFAQTFGPVLAGIAIQSMALAAPFLIAGGLKTTYDLALYAGFRSRRGDHELG